MSLSLVLPSQEKRTALYLSEGRIYWSRHVDVYLRKCGLLYDNNPSSLERSFALFTRGADIQSVSLDTPGFLEGPIDSVWLKKNGIKAVECEAEELRLRFEDEKCYTGIGGIPQLLPFGRPKANLRRIPKERGEVSTPYLYEEVDLPYSTKFQTFKTSPDWKVLVHIHVPDQDIKNQSVIITNGRLVISGVPIFDLICETLSMPHCPDGFYSTDRPGVFWDHERWLADTIIDAATSAERTVYQVSHWPNGLKSAFSVRHDYDRPISDEIMVDLLEFYKKHDVKCSMSFLARLLPDNQGAMLLGGGHEINLHTEAAEEKDLSDEIRVLEKHFLEPIKGVTCHGGIGSAGHLGATLFQWCEKNNLTYTERNGHHNAIPTPALLPEGSEGKKISTMIMSNHLSLDRGTGPHAHFLQWRMNSIPHYLASGWAVNVMNHPDIHVPELKTLIQSLDLTQSWKATHLEITEWCRNTKFDLDVIWENDSPKLIFATALLHNLEVKKHSASKTQVTTIKKGQTVQDLANAKWKNSDRRTLSGEVTEIAAAEFRKDFASREDIPLENFEQSNLTAIIVRSAREASAALAEYKKSRGVFRYPPSRVFVLSISGGKLELLEGINDQSNFFHAGAGDMFDLVYVDKNVRLFDTAYAASFIAQLAHIAKSDGKIMFPVWEPERRKVGISPERLSEIIGSVGVKVRGDTDYFVFGGPFSPTDGASVLSWYLKNSTALLLDELNLRVVGQKYNKAIKDTLIEEFLLPGEITSRTTQIVKLKGETSSINKTITKNIESIANSQAYLIGGLSYKAPLIEHIIRTMMPERKGLVYGDVGGGIGALPAELIITCPDLIKKGIVRDISLQHMFMAKRMYQGLYEPLQGKFHFSLGTAEDFPYAEGYDVLTFIASLVYTDRDQIKQTLQKAWDGISLGGLLIIHENIKAKSFTKDHDIMFEAEELNGLLSPFGEIEYFVSGATSKIMAEKVENRTVFRVIQKVR